MARKLTMQQKIAKAGRLFGHPLRVRLWLTISEGDKLSPRMMADETGMPLGNVSYHVRELLQAGAIKLVAKKPRRGAIEHFYSAEFTPQEVYEAVIAEARRSQ